MSQFFIKFWNSISTYEQIGLILAFVFGLYLLYKRSTARCPKCASKFKRVDEENNLIERITNSMTHGSGIDPELPDTRFYRCKGCGFETDNLRTMKFTSKLSKLESNDSRSSGFK